MKILHISDWHGDMSLDSGDSDIIVCSGDLLPNRSLGQRDRDSQVGKASLAAEKNYQTAWVLKNIEKFKSLIGAKPFLFCPGNHDFINPVPLLKDAGLNAIDLENKREEVLGFSFYGFPYINYIVGEWQYELIPTELAAKTQEIPLETIDVLVAHCPPYGFLDMAGGHKFGNSALSGRLYYGCEKWPRMILCGHLHPSFGIIELPNGGERGHCIISNAATGARMLELKKKAR